MRQRWILDHPFHVPTSSRARPPAPTMNQASRDSRIRRDTGLRVRLRTRPGSECTAGGKADPSLGTSGRHRKGWYRLATGRVGADRSEGDGCPDPDFFILIRQGVPATGVAGFARSRTADFGALPMTPSDRIASKRVFFGLLLQASRRACAARGPTSENPSAEYRGGCPRFTSRSTVQVHQVHRGNQSEITSGLPVGVTWPRRSFKSRRPITSDHSPCPFLRTKAVNSTAS